MFRFPVLVAAACIGYAAYLAAQQGPRYVPRYVKLPPPEPEPPAAPEAKGALSAYFTPSGRAREFSAN